VRRDVENVKGQVELVVQRVASELLLFKDAEIQLFVKRVLSLWTECTTVMLAKGNLVTEELISIQLLVVVKQLTV